jgi:hypothetical protein
MLLDGANYNRLKEQGQAHHSARLTTINSMPGGGRSAVS